jgi:hypothetical protein
MVTVPEESAKIPFPPPDFVINGRRYWKRRTLRQHRNWLESHARRDVDCDALEPLPPLPDDNDLVGSAAVKKENGNICDMTLWRWMHPERSSAKTRGLIEEDAT